MRITTPSTWTRTRRAVVAAATLTAAALGAAGSTAHANGYDGNIACGGLRGYVDGVVITAGVGAHINWKAPGNGGYSQTTTTGYKWFAGQIGGGGWFIAGGDSNYIYPGGAYCA